MRNIKFRAWDEISEEIYDANSISHWRLSEAFGREKTKFPNWTFMQYIGLPDKNGTEIYEGDIVQDGIYRREVIFHKGVFCYQDGPNQFHIFADKDCEVIGNIYENPELIANQ